MSTHNLLLLTATITPKSGVPNLKRNDPLLRIQDYVDAFEYYLTQVGKAIDCIIFVENSNSDISQLQTIVDNQGLANKVEFIVFNGLDYPVHYDRGYGEFMLLDYGMANSQLIRNLPHTETVIWKVTGRYIIQNLAQIISSQPTHFDLYCNCRNYPKYWVDTYAIAWTPEGYETCLRDVFHRLKTNVPGIPKGIAAEELLRSWLEQRFIKKYATVIRRFRITPSVKGIRGADNREYSTNETWKYNLRNSFKKLFPWIWI